MKILGTLIVLAGIIGILSVFPFLLWILAIIAGIVILDIASKRKKS
jgi:hypothetical protein